VLQNWTTTAQQQRHDDLEDLHRGTILRRPANRNPLEPGAFGDHIGAFC
jgi:hypothetical protein